MRILITGTAGFIGFHLARRLLEEGNAVYGFDGLTTYYDVWLKEQRLKILEKIAGFRQFRGLLEDPTALAKAADAAKPDIIVHLAAQAGVRYSIDNPRAYVDANLVGGWNVLEVARAVQPRHLLFASTSSIYGAAERAPFRETDPTDRPLTLYAASKKALEAMAHSYAHLYGIPTTGLRFFTVYGPWGRPDMAPFKFVDAIASGRPIDIYGHAQMKRDFTYVADVVESIRRLLAVVPSEANRMRVVSDTLSPVAPYRVLNIGGGRPVDLLDFIATIEKHVGRPAERRMLPMQPGDVPSTEADSNLLHALTGFLPKTTVDEGVASLVEWYRTVYATAQRT